MRSYIPLLLFNVFWFFKPQSGEEILCQPGQKSTISRDRCVPCPKDQYRSKPGRFVDCENCFTCGKYSIQMSPCTSTKNTVCICSVGFEDKFNGAICKCPIGSGIQQENGKIVCVKCPNGTFTSQSDSMCQAWKQCDSSGEEKPGSPTSDVICKNATKEVQTVETSTLFNTPSNVPTIASSYKDGSSKYTTSIPAIRRQHILWLGPFAACLVLFLILWLIIKIKIIKCFHIHKNGIIQKDSTCKKPVEESGEKYSSPCLSQNSSLI